MQNGNMNSDESPVVPDGESGDAVVIPRSGISPAQREQLRDELQHAISRLTRSLKTSRRASKPVALDQSSVGRLSRMDALQNQSMSQGLQEREQVRLTRLAAALQRLEDGGFGICTGCRGPIAFERLLVFPETLICGTCAVGESG